jgi:rubredoxin
MKIGDAPCEYCNWHIYDIPLSDETVPADDGGTWITVERPFNCPSCGQELKYMNVPKGSDLVWDVPELVRLEVSR